jgi:hypothetical protein
MNLFPVHKFDFFLFFQFSAPKICSNATTHYREYVDNRLALIDKTNAQTLNKVDAEDKIRKQQFMEKPSASPKSETSKT